MAVQGDLENARIALTADVENARVALKGDLDTVQTLLEGKITLLQWMLGFVLAAHPALEVVRLKTDRATGLPTWTVWLCTRGRARVIATGPLPGPGSARSAPPRSAARLDRVSAGRPRGWTAPGQRRLHPALTPDSGVFVRFPTEILRGEGPPFRFHGPGGPGRARWSARIPGKWRVCYLDRGISATWTDPLRGFAIASRIPARAPDLVGKMLSRSPRAPGCRRLFCYGEGGSVFFLLVVSNSTKGEEEFLL